jgi:hypothetical protein
MRECKMAAGIPVAILRSNKTADSHIFEILPVK